MALMDKETLEKEKRKLEKKIEVIEKKLIKLNEPAKIGFVYKNRIV